MDNIRLSLIIATYNRGQRLAATMGSLTRQTLAPESWELVVVDNNSIDDTAEVFGAFAAAHPELSVRMVREENQGISYARNRGAEEAAGEYVVYLDDDELVDDTFLQEYNDFFEDNPGAVAAGGRIEARYEAELPKWFSKYTERAIAGTINLGDKIRPFPSGKFFGGGNMGMRRSVFDRYGLFDPNLGRKGKKVMGGEEKDFYMRLKAAGETIWYLPRAVIYHLIPAERLSPEYFLNLCSMIGRSERVRTQGISRMAYLKRLLMEAVKWCGVVVISTGYLLSFRPAKAVCLYKMRWRITRGLLGRE